MNTIDDQRYTSPAHCWMDMALDQARLALERGEVPVGALVVRLSDGAVLAQAHNLREQTHDPSAHAEIAALRLAGQALGDWRLTGCALVVTLEPCAMCAAAAVAARVEQVIFGAYDHQRGACGSILHIPGDRRLNPKPILVTGGIEEQECLALLRQGLGRE